MQEVHSVLWLCHRWEKIVGQKTVATPANLHKAQCRFLPGDGPKKVTSTQTWSSWIMASYLMGSLEKWSWTWSATSRRWHIWYPQDVFGEKDLLHNHREHSRSYAWFRFVTSVSGGTFSWTRKAQSMQCNNIVTQDNYLSRRFRWPSLQHTEQWKPAILEHLTLYGNVDIAMMSLPIRRRQLLLPHAADHCRVLRSRSKLKEERQANRFNRVTGSQEKVDLRTQKKTRLFRPWGIMLLSYSGTIIRAPLKQPKFHKSEARCFRGSHGIG